MGEIASRAIGESSKPTNWYSSGSFPYFWKIAFKNIGSIISVVGKTTVGIIELFECTQKVP